MSAKKGNSSKGRTKVKGLPAKDKKLSSTDLKKIKGGVIGSSGGTGFKYKPPTGG
jgi:hypothetical protein